MGIRHAFESEVADGGDDSLVRPSDWNADHVVTGTRDTLDNIMRFATMSANSTPDGTKPASFAVDGNPSNFWYGGTGGNGWLKADLGSAFSVSGFRMLSLGCLWKLQSSTDNSNWTDRTVAQASPYTDTGVQMFTSPITARYWRWLNTQGAGPDAAISEMELYQSVVPVTLV